MTPLELVILVYVVGAVIGSVEGANRYITGQTEGAVFAAFVYGVGWPYRFAWTLWCLARGVRYD